MTATADLPYAGPGTTTGSMDARLRRCVRSRISPLARDHVDDDHTEPDDTGLCELCKTELRQLPETS